MNDDIWDYSDDYWNYSYPEELLGVRLERTCFACPEQYDVYEGDTQIAYLRLRHGTFRAVVPDVGGEVVYTSNPRGDGVFHDSERTEELTKAIQAVLKYVHWGNK